MTPSKPEQPKSMWTPTSREEFMTSNENLVHKIVHKLNFYKKFPNHRDDFLQEGRLALLHAYDTFDDSRGVQLTTYAYVIVQNSLHRYARNEKLYRHDIPFEDGYVMVDTDAEDQVIMEELIGLMKEDTNQSILLDYFVNGYTQAETASRNFCTQQRVSQVVMEFRRKVVDLWN